MGGLGSNWRGSSAGREACLVEGKAVCKSVFLVVNGAGLIGLVRGLQLISVVRTASGSSH